MSTNRRLHAGLTLTLAAALAAGCSSGGPSDLAAIESAAKATTFKEQVAAGQSLFTLHCAECHGGAGQGEDAPRLVGLKQGALPLDPPADRKFRKQKFVTVADVADFATHNMPPRNPGSLGKDAYWAILAFDLHANGLDLPQKLTPDVAKATTIPR
jgi:mono/diheme cytochrome c family protein